MYQTLLAHRGAATHSYEYYCVCACAEQGVAPEAVAEAYHAYEQGSQVSPLSAAAVSNQSIQESQRLLLLVRAYQASSYLLSVPIAPTLHSDDQPAQGRVLPPGHACSTACLASPATSGSPAVQIRLNQSPAWAHC